MAANQRHCPGHGRCTTPNDRAWDVSNESNVTDRYVRATSWYAVVLVYDGWLKRWHLQTFGTLKMMNLRTFHRNSTIPLAALSRILHHVYNSIVISVASAAQWSALHLNLTNLSVAIHLCYSWYLLWVPTSWKVSNVAKKDKHLENPRNDKKTYHKKCLWHWVRDLQTSHWLQKVVRLVGIPVTIEWGQIKYLTFQCICSVRT